MLNLLLVLAELQLDCYMMSKRHWIMGFSVQVTEKVQKAMLILTGGDVDTGSALIF
jgi:hypothetical protein